MSNIDYFKMEQAFEKALKSWSKGGGGFGGGGGGAPGPGAAPGPNSSTGLMDKALTTLTKELGATSGAVGRSLLDLSGHLVKGGAKVSDVTGALASNFQAAGREGSNLSKALGGAGVALDEVVKYVEEGIDVFRDLSTAGAAFNNDVIEMRVSAANTRMTLDDYASVIRNNSKTLAGLGASVNSGVKVFNEFSKAFFDNTELNDQLRNMGYTTKDLNELLALNLSINRFTGKLSREAMDKQIESTAMLAKEMDMVAKLTGKSRREQENELRKQQENGQIRAGIELAVRKGGEGVRQAFTQMSTASAIGGEAFKRMQEEIFAMGRPSQEMAEQFSAAGGAVQELMFKAAAAAKRGDEAEAKRLTQEAAVQYSMQSRSTAMLELSAQNVGFARNNLESSMKLGDAMEAVAKQNNLNLNVEKDRTKALELAKEKIKKEQDNVAGATKAVIAAEGRMADAAAAVNNVFVKRVNEAADPALKKFAEYLGSSTEGLGNLRKKLEDPFDKAFEKIEKREANNDSLRAAMAKGAQSSTGNLENADLRQAVVNLDKVIRGNGPVQEKAVAKLEELAKAKGQTKEQYIEGVMSRADVNEIKKLTETLNVLERTTREGVRAPSAVRGTREQGGQGKTISEAMVEGGANLYAESINGLKNMLKPGGGASVEVTKLPDGTTIVPPKPEAVPKPEPRSGGTYGAGLDTEKVGSILKITSPGEVVLNAKQQKELASGLIDKGAKKAVEGLKNAVVQPAKTTGNLDLSTINNDIKTTFSSVSSQTSAPSAEIERSIDFGKIGLSDQQKKVFDEMISLSSEESKKRLESLKLEQQAAANTNKEVLAARDAIEEKYEKEGRLSELKDNEEYKRLTEQLNASATLSKEKKKEVDAAVQAENTRSNIAKLYGKSLDELKTAQTSAAEEVAKSAELTKTSIVGSLPISEVEQTSKALSTGLTQTQQDFLNVLLETDEESLKLKEGGYKKQIEADIANLKTAEEEIASVKSQIENSTSETEKRRLSRRLESLEKEKVATEDAKKFSEEQLKVVERAILAKKGEIKATEETISATKEKSALDSNIVKVREDIKQELTVTGVPVTEEQKAEVATTPATVPSEQPKTETPKVEPAVAAPTDQSAAEAARLKQKNNEAVRSSIVGKDGKINLNNVFGLGGFGQELKAKPKEPEAAASAAKNGQTQMANQAKSENAAKEKKEAEQQSQAETERLKRQNAATTAASPKPSAPAAKKEATLEDVVSSLNRLNTQMSQLIDQQGELLNKQIRTTKSTASSSIYDRTVP